jgi:glycosyltransferase involved in cell wall biosynthesis
VQELAQEATDTGERLLAQGDAAGARPWLERAHRLAPEADNIAFALATALVRLGDPGGAPLFVGLAGRHDVEPVWIGLAAACAVAGDWTGAASALGTLLGRFRLADPRGVTALADRVVERAGAPGWCGVAEGGRVVVRLAPGSAGRAVVAQDGAVRRGVVVDESGGAVTVRLGGRDLLGSPVEAARFGRIEGAVAPADDGIAGWAWHPADPGRDPELTVILPAANAGLRAAAALPGERDVVLLNSDTLPAPGWLERLRAVVHATPDIGTACPLSNDATILSYPDATAINPVPGAAERAALGALAAATHPATAVDVPTGVGFCLYVRHECLLQTGLLRPDVFAQGYGEENDFCLRARRLGWRHVAVPGAYVAHVGGASFGNARAALLARNLDLLERLHPGYRALIAAWQAADPLAPARRALDAAGWAAARRGGGKGNGEARRRSVLLITHDNRGGVERAVRARIAAHAAEGCATVLLRPVADHSGSRAGERTLPGMCAVSDGAEGTFPNLRFRLPEELDALVALLRGDGIERVEVHHLLGHDRSVLDLPHRLGVPYEVRVHDYAWFCPRINLVGAERRYCGEPEAQVCEGCVADAGEDLADASPPTLLRSQSTADLAAASRVVVPSHDAAARLARHFPAVRALVAPHEDDADLPPLRPTPARQGRRRVVAVPGAIGTAKGYDVLLACARDAALRDLALSFVVVGHTEDDARLLATGRAFVTGPYREEDAQALLRAQDAAFAWVPSIWPETWCYALGHALRAGLAVAAFDIGAQAERIRATGRGWLLPLGLPPGAINNALLALRVVAGDECARPIGPGAVPAPADSHADARARHASFHDASTSTARS